MYLNKSLFVLLTFEIFFIKTFSFKYEVVLPNEDIFSRCAQDDVKFIMDYVDFSNLSFEILSNQSIYVNGFANFTRDFDETKNPLRLNLFKKKRNTWINTIYSLYREDACFALFDPKELWAIYATHIEPSQRKCPFFKGQLIHVDDIADIGLHFVDPHLAGEYKLQVVVILEQFNEIFCDKSFK